MYQLSYYPLFERKLRQLIKKSPSLEKKIDKVLEFLEIDPLARPLKTHKVVTKTDGREAFSSEINGDLRILWRFDEDEIKILNIIDIGGHSGCRKVYR